MIERDITLHCYDDEYSLVTIDEMRELLSKQQAFEPETDGEPIDCELSRDNEDQLYDSSYFWIQEPDLLRTHLLAEQCFEHFEDVSWQSLTDGYNERILRTIEYVIHKPLIWFNLRPDNGSVLLDGRMAIEVFSEERLTEKPYSDFLQTMHNRRLLWFADNLPTAKDLIVPDATINLPEEKPLWYMLTTDFSDEAYTQLLPSWVMNNEYDNAQETPNRSVCFSTAALTRNLEFIAKERGGARAAFLVAELRKAWAEIVALKYFGSDRLSKEEKEEFREWLFEGLNNYMEQWKNYPQPEQPQSSPAAIAKKFKHFSIDAAIDGVAKDLEEILKEKSKAPAHELIKVLADPKNSKYWDFDIFDATLNISGLYNDLDEHFGLSYGYNNFLAAVKAIRASHRANS